MRSKNQKQKQRKENRPMQTGSKPETKAAAKKRGKKGSKANAGEEEKDHGSEANTGEEEKDRGPKANAGEEEKDHGSKQEDDKGGLSPRAQQVRRKLLFEEETEQDTGGKPSADKES